MNNDESPKKSNKPAIKNIFFLNMFFSNKKNNIKKTKKFIMNARTTALDWSIKINGSKRKKLMTVKIFQNFLENFDINKNGIERNRVEDSKFLFANDPVIDLTLKLRSWLDFKRIKIWKHTITSVKNTDTTTALAKIITLNLLL